MAISMQYRARESDSDRYWLAIINHEIAAESSEQRL